MEAKSREEVQLMIESEIARTEKSITNYEKLTKPIAPDNSIGRVSRMDAINNKSVNEAALYTAIQKLEGLKAA